MILFLKMWSAIKGILWCSVYYFDSSSQTLRKSAPITKIDRTELSR